MTQERAIHKIEFSIKAYQNLIDQNVSEGEVLGNGVQGKWQSDKAPIQEYQEMIDALTMAKEALEQEPKRGHWINKNHLFETCSAECSSCHKRSNGYVHDNGFSLECKYYNFCPKCGSDNREVEE